VIASDLADLLLLHIRAARLPLPIRDYQTLLPRKFKIDLAFVDLKIAIEVDGGEQLRNGGGRHNRAAGMANDCVKQNLLVLAGWKTLRFTGGQVKDGSALAVVREALRALGELPH
jgi:very-short-patch-repair endonuclease